MINKKFFMILLLTALFLITIGIVSGIPNCECNEDLDCNPPQEECETEDAFGTCRQVYDELTDEFLDGYCKTVCLDTCWPGDICPDGWTWGQGLCDEDISCCKPITCGNVNVYPCGNCLDLDDANCSTCCKCAIGGAGGGGDPPCGDEWCDETRGECCATCPHDCDCGQIFALVVGIDTFIPTTPIPISGDNLITGAVPCAFGYEKKLCTEIAVADCDICGCGTPAPCTGSFDFSCNDCNGNPTSDEDCKTCCECCGDDVCDPGEGISCPTDCGDCIGNNNEMCNFPIPLATAECVAEPCCQVNAMITDCEPIPCEDIGGGCQFCQGCSDSVPTLSSCTAKAVGDIPSDECSVCTCSNQDGFCGGNYDCCSGLYCDIDDGRCCPAGCEWNDVGGYCDCHSPCYNAPCAYRPPNDPGGNESSWWSDIFCLNTTASTACCYYGPMYGDPDWYDWANIVIY